MNAIILLLWIPFAYASEDPSPAASSAAAASGEKEKKFDLAASALYAGPTIFGGYQRSHAPGLGIAFGYNITNRSTVGLLANFFRGRKDEVGVSSEYTEKNFSFTYRYWLLSKSENWSPYVQAGVGMSHDHVNFTYSSEGGQFVHGEWSEWKPVFSGGLGVRYKLAKNMGLDFGVHSDIKLTTPGWVYGQVGLSYEF